MLKLWNTLTRKKEIFKPLRDKTVGLYTCGQTVYDYTHIGNLRYYIFTDILKRTLEYDGYKVKHVMNITDVGHLTSDADEGEDKLEKGALREGKTVWDIAKFYTQAFLRDTKRLNIKSANILAPATHYIKEQIKIVEILIKKSFTYETSQAIYFDVSKFKNYTKLSRQKLTEKIQGVRKKVVLDAEKKNPADFALWFKTIGRFKNHIMRWPSPWGNGFPGWHIECSAISSKFLGQPFDIHTGGVDHIAVHHTNEIAQSEAAFNKPLARFWLHGEFLLIDQSKMAKSKGNFFTLDDIAKKHFDPLAFRYLVLTSHYRSKLNFTWKSLAGSQSALNKLRAEFNNLYHAKKSTAKTDESLRIKKLGNEFKNYLNDDLNTPAALAFVWKIIKDKQLSPQTKIKLISNFDKVLGFGLSRVKTLKIPQKIMALAKKREELRRNKQFIQADRLRKRIEALGYMVEDTTSGPHVLKKS